MYTDKIFVRFIKSTSKPSSVNLYGFYHLCLTILRTAFGIFLLNPAMKAQDDVFLYLLKFIVSSVNWSVNLLITTHW